MLAKEPRGTVVCCTAASTLLFGPFSDDVDAGRISTSPSAGFEKAGLVRTKTINLPLSASDHRVYALTPSSEEQR